MAKFPGKLSGKVAMVSAGAGAGIGGSIVRAFIAEGATLIVTDRSGQRLEALAEDIGVSDASEPHLLRELDACDETAVVNLFTDVETLFGRLDILVNSVGFTRPARITQMDVATWSEVLDICLTSHFLHIRAALPIMERQQAGSIINISSITAWSGSELGEAHYAAAKAGVLGLTKAAAGECAPSGIRVNAVAPGLIWNEHLTMAVPEHYIRAYESRSMMGQAGKPEDVAKTVLFLASDDSTHITGETIVVAGGYVARH